MTHVIEAVVFDADGMIVEHVPRFSSVLEKERGIPIKITKPFFEGPFQQCLVGKADLKEELTNVLDVWGWKGDVEDLMEYWFSPSLAPINIQFAAVIQQLQKVGLKTYLATNNEKYRTKNLVEERGLGKWFNKVFSSSVVGAKKRTRDFQQHVLDSTGHQKARIQFWDDDPENIEAVKAFGFDAHQYRDFKSFQRIIDTLVAQL